MLIIAGHLDVDPARRDEYVAAHVDLLRRARHAPGCLDVAVTADPDEPARVWMYERWRSWEHVRAWRAVAHAPELDVEVRDVQVAMWDATGERSPFQETPDGGS